MTPESLQELCVISSHRSTSNPTRRLRLTYITALSIIAAMTITTQIGLWKVIDRLSSDSALINVAGRQRMLSQRVAKEALRIDAAVLDGDTHAVTEHREALENAFALWSSSHDRLLEKDADDGLGGLNSPQILALFDELDPIYNDMRVSIEAVLSISTDAQAHPEIEPQLRRSGEDVSELTDAYLPIMHAIVNLYETESIAKVRSLHRAELAVGAVTLLVLLLEALLVFEPATRMLRKSLTAAQHASKAKSEFLANMSHEIRTPMTAILGYTQILREEFEGNADKDACNESIETVQRNGKHLLTLINDILDMSKIEAGKLSIERIETNPVQIVEEAVSLMRPKSLEKRVDLKVEYLSEMPEHVMSDPVRVRQILINLIGNAVKFTDDGDVKVRVSADKDKGCLRFEIVDSGIGMSQEQVEVIRRFDAFTQADTSTTRKFGGTGLGLKISKTLANLLGGDIDIQSVHGEGSTFSLELRPEGMDSATYIDPHSATMRDYAEAAKSADASIRAQSTTSDQLRGIRVLLAEDGVDNQRLITHYIKKAGGTITVAENGRVALEHMGDDPNSEFDVVLMDMQMPELDGYSAARVARTKGFTIPIIALTAHAMPEDREKCLNAGCTEFLTKPVKPAQLVGTILEWVGKPHGGQSAAA